MSFPMYADADSMDSDFVAALRQNGVDVRTANEEGKQHLDDNQQLEYARQLRRVIYTGNVGDFSRLHTQYLTSGVTHAGIIIIKQGAFGIGERLRRVLRMQSSLSIEEMKDRLEYLSNW